MTTDGGARAEEVFLRVAEAPEGQRSALLEALCAGDSGLRAEVASLLAYHQEDSGFLSHAALGDLSAGSSLESPVPEGTRVAGFTLGTMIGSGGHGFVYVAEQERPRRTVAIKLIRPGLGESGLLRRFEREAELLGRLQHPGIAQVYEAGTADLSAAGGSPRQPFIAMELIRGSPLTEYAEGSGLDLRRRLDLIARVCDAVQHAHQRGVIHRDLKPANILVDETGQPKVLDFGVARATGVDAQTNTLRTGVGQLVGTLSYMSPEQVLADPAEIDTRADVYALGVSLYQLLTGRLPLDLSGRPLPEAARIVRDHEPPRPGSLNRAVRGEVETIILKALAKDRARRYQSAAELGQDIRRYLAGRPIAAKDDSALYVLRKQLSRHRALAAAALLFLVMLAAFAVYAQIEAGRSARLAAAEHAASARLAEELVVSNTERGRLYARTGKVVAAEDLLWSQHLRDPGSPSTLWALWDVYSRSHCVATVRGHTAPVLRMEFSPDARRLYTAGDDGAVCAWDPATGRRLGQWKTASGVMGLSIRPDGSEIASSHNGGWVVIRNAESGEERLRFRAHPGKAECIAFSPDGLRLATGGADHKVSLWDAATGKPLGEASTSAGNIRDVAWAGPFIASCAYATGTTIATSDATGPPRTVLPSLEAHAVSLSPDGRLLAVGNASLSVRIVDTGSGEEVAAFRGPSSVPRWLGFTQDGSMLVAACWWTIETWDVARKASVRSIGLREPAYSCAVSHDGTLLAAGYKSGWMQLWDLSDRGALRRLPPHAGRTESAMSPDGALVVTGDESGMLRVWRASDGALLARMVTPDGRIRRVQFTPDGAMVATTTDRGIVKVWDLATGRAPIALDGAATGFSSTLAFSADGTRLALVKSDGSVELRSFPDMRVVAQRAPPGADPFLGVTFGAPGGQLALATNHRTLHLWNPASDAFTDVPQVTAASVSFSPDGRWLVSSGPSDAGVYLYTLSAPDPSGQPLGPQTDMIARACFLPAGRPGEPATVAVASADGVVRLFDAASRRELIALEGLNSWESVSVSFSRDRRFMATSGFLGAAVIWDLGHFLAPIAGNAEYQIDRLGAGEQAGATEVRRWADSILQAPAAHSANGVDPATIEAWGRATLE